MDCYLFINVKNIIIFVKQGSNNAIAIIVLIVVNFGMNGVEIVEVKDIRGSDGVVVKQNFDHVVNEVVASIVVEKVKKRCEIVKIRIQVLVVRVFVFKHRLFVYRLIVSKID